jgi:hypothetical protein
VRVELSAEAAAQVQDIDIWWREHRRAPPWICSPTNSMLLC